MVSTSRPAAKAPGPVPANNPDRADALPRSNARRQSPWPGFPGLRTASGQVGWVLLVLRAYFAFVFLYAGVSKVADSSFLNDKSLTGIHAQLQAVRPASPIGSLLGPIESHSLAFGLIFSVAEIAVGLGLLFGLFTRIAALGAMALSMSFFLTISWGANPWYTSADIGYFFALTPLLIGGAGGVLSLDAWLASAARRLPGASEDHTRRALLGGAAVVGTFALLGIAALFRDSGNSDRAPDAGGTGSDPTPSPNSPSPTASGSTTGSTAGPGSGSASSSPSPSPTGAALVATSEVAVGAAKQVKDPKSGDPAYVLQLSAGQFTALDAVCPHQQCTVGFVSAQDGFLCPCHGSRFSAQGKLLNGPATSGLTSIPVTVVDGTVRRA